MSQSRREKIIKVSLCRNNDGVVKTDKKFERFEEFSIYTKSTMYTDEEIQTQHEKFSITFLSKHEKKLLPILKFH